MHIPVVEKFKSPLTPWEVYQAVYPAHRVSFFLDSHHYAPPAQTFSYIGFDPFLEVTLRKGKIYLEGELRKVLPQRCLLRELRKVFKKYAAHCAGRFPFFTGGAIGYWGYELAEIFEKVRFRAKPGARMPVLCLGFYRNLIVFDHRRGSYWLVTNVAAPRGLPARELRRKSAEALQGLKKIFDRAAERNIQKTKNSFHVKNFRPEISRTHFEKLVGRAKRYIEAGDIYQANLSQRFSFGLRGSLLELYGKLREINPSPFSSLVKTGETTIVSSSPERLVRKRGRLCETLPIAGTRPRRLAGMSEAKLACDLRANEKERAEHIMLVDLERNDLGRVCRWPTVRVKNMMTIEKYSHVIHLVSRIQGIIKKDKDAFDLIKAMFPGGTITGCPKVRCMEIIDELEPVRRGIYTGSIGYVDFYGDLDLNIVIRTLVIAKNKGYLQVGAGIVYDSDPKREYEETLHKGEALVEALVRASVE